MITVKTNINQVVQVTLSQLNNLADTDRLLRTCATSVLGLMKNRIHEQGLDADGKRIGTYSKGYMVVRTGAYQNATKVAKGKNSGKLKDAGVFTKKLSTVLTQEDEDTVTSKRKVMKIAFLNKLRPKYNRTGDTKVVLSLTRQMENDMKVIATPNGYGIGYTNRFNYDKSQWNEATYNLKGKIFSLSQSEEKAVTEIVNKHVTDAFPG